MGGYADIFITEQSLSAIVIILLIIALAFAIPAFFIRWSKKRLFEIENDFLLFGILCYLVYMIDWLVMFPPMYRVNLIALGQLKIYASFKHDLNLYLRLIFISTLLSWSILWSIKLSLLLLYKRLMRGLPAQLRWWWVVFVFTIATYVFSIVTTFTSCGGPVLMLKDPAVFCKRPGDDMTRNLSFYGSFACDVSTDVLIMILPIQLIWKSLLTTRRKLSIGAMFAVGGLCIIAAVIRLVQINSKTGDKNPNNEWIALWGSVEATTAIVVGCLPAFRYCWQSATPTAISYGSQPPSKGSRIRQQSIPLTTRSSDKKTTLATSAWASDTGSQENLAPKNGIRITTDYQMEESDRSRAYQG